MRTICGWCKKYMHGEAAYEGELVSHSVCDDCREKVKRETQEALEKDRQRASGG